MSNKKTWSALGWPWELDLLALVFVVVSLIGPYLIYSEHFASRTTLNPVAAHINEQTYILWAIGICVLFAMHLALAGSLLDNLSTPFLHLLAPLVFALLAYYRIFAVSHDMGDVTPVNGSAAQIVLTAGGALFASLLLARFRMMRHRMRFRETVWDKTEASAFDSSFFELIIQFRPLVYPPRRYRASQEGILVEGWFYTFAMPFEMIQSISAVRTMNIATDGDYYATNTKNLVRFELLDRSKPIFISPDNREEFIQYCAHHVARIRPPGTKHGTMSGLYARHTHAGGTGGGSAKAGGTQSGTTPTPHA